MKMLVAVSCLRLRKILVKTLCLLHLLLLMLLPLLPLATELTNYTRLSKKIIHRADDLANLSPYNPIVHEITMDFKPTYIPAKIVISSAVTITSYIKVGLDIEPTVIFFELFRNWYNLIHHYFLYCLRPNFTTSLTSRA
jgi:hypothetical protein